jgi:hypothetical protein
MSISMAARDERSLSYEAEVASPCREDEPDRRTGLAVTSTCDVPTVAAYMEALGCPEQCLEAVIFHQIDGEELGQIFGALPRREAIDVLRQELHVPTTIVAHKIARVAVRLWNESSTRDDPSYPRETREELRPKYKVEHAPKLPEAEAGQKITSAQYQAYTVCLSDWVHPWSARLAEGIRILRQQPKLEPSNLCALFDTTDTDLDTKLATELYASADDDLKRRLLDDKKRMVNGRPSGLAVLAALGRRTERMILNCVS